jgi:hypothetical protein
MKLRWELREGRFVAGTRTGFAAGIRLAELPSVAWLTHLALDGTVVHEGEYASLKKAKRAITKAMKRAIELRPTRET